MLVGYRRVAGAASSDRLPVHRSESPTGYSLTGCSPAEPVSASPLAGDRSRSGPSSKCAACLCCDLGCHFYFARRVTFLSCADTAYGAMRPVGENKGVSAASGRIKTQETDIRPPGSERSGVHVESDSGSPTGKFDKCSPILALSMRLQRAEAMGCVPNLPAFWRVVRTLSPHQER